MPKRREPTFEECLLLMRSRDPQLAEDGFHFLRPRAKEHLARLIEAFRTERVHSIRCWLLQLIGEARSEDAFAVLCEQAVSPDESLRNWGVTGLELLDTKASRAFLFENGLKR
jgi:hypothetical protein